MSQFSVSAGAEIDFPSDQSEEYQMLALLASSKPGASEIAKMIFTSPGVNFALMNSVSTATMADLACTVSVRVESAKLPELWAWLWEKNHDLLVSYGLQGVMMQSGTIVWVKEKALGKSVGQSVGRWVHKWSQN